LGMASELVWARVMVLVLVEVWVPAMVRVLVVVLAPEMVPETVVDLGRVWELGWELASGRVLVADSAPVSARDLAQVTVLELVLD
jgi:hypothetical protein